MRLLQEKKGRNCEKRKLFLREKFNVHIILLAEESSARNISLQRRGSSGATFTRMLVLILTARFGRQELGSGSQTRSKTSSSRMREMTIIFQRRIMTEMARRRMSFALVILISIGTKYRVERKKMTTRPPRMSWVSMMQNKLGAVRSSAIQETF
jgi:hypothetical protein